MLRQHSMEFKTNSSTSTEPPVNKSNTLKVYLILLNITNKSWHYHIMPWKTPSKSLKRTKSICRRPRHKLINPLQNENLYQRTAMRRSTLNRSHITTFAAILTQWSKNGVHRKLNQHAHQSLNQAKIFLSPHTIRFHCHSTKLNRVEEKHNKCSSILRF